jgi:hypothetical protein
MLFTSGIAPRQRAQSLSPEGQLAVNSRRKHLILALAFNLDHFDSSCSLPFPSCRKVHSHGYTAPELGSPNSRLSDCEKRILKALELGDSPCPRSILLNRLSQRKVDREIPARSSVKGRESRKQMGIYAIIFRYRSHRINIFTPRLRRITQFPCARVVAVPPSCVLTASPSAAHGEYHEKHLHQFIQRKHLPGNGDIMRS